MLSRLKDSIHTSFFFLFLLLRYSLQKIGTTKAMSTVPEITEAEATTKKPSVPDNSTKTTTSSNGRTSHQDETSETNNVSHTAKQYSTISNLQNEHPMQNPSNENPQDGSSKREDKGNTKQDSTNANSQTEPPNQDLTSPTPQDKTTASNSKRDYTCLPFRGLLTPKGTKAQSKSPANAYSKDKLVESIEEEIKGTKAQSKSPANAYSKDRLAESTKEEIKGTKAQSKSPANAYSKDELAESIEDEIKYIKDETKRLNNYTTQIDSELNEALESLELLKQDEDHDSRSLRDLKKAVTKLKLQIPKQKADIEDKDPHKDPQAGTLKLKPREISDRVMKQMPRLYKDDLFVKSPEFRDLEDRFNQLPVKLKLCLLCFSIFPGNEDIEKRLMVYWWMIEGLLPPIPNDKETRKVFEELTKKGFIEPVNRKRSLSVGSYRVHPFISTALVMLAEKAKFFDFENGEPTQKFSKSLQACLVGKGLIDYDDLREGKVSAQELEKLHTVINVNEHILEFRKEWLLKMKNVNILYLGRWKASATYHIEVEDEEEKDFLEGLQNMNHLKFFSLQGVSRIMELPESISKLSNLLILDLRACHSLESIPEKIGLLYNLTHLDITECYLLEHMPKGIASLSELRVLKGFVVGESKNSCNLKDLATLRNLIKLSIHTGLVAFPEQKDIEALQEFKALSKLSIAWGGEALKVPSSKNTSEATEQPGEGKKKENTRGKNSGSASQGLSSEVPEPPKPDGLEIKENIRKMRGGDASKPRSSRTGEALKPDEGEREKEKTREKQGDSASVPDSSKASEALEVGRERQKDTTKEIKEEGNLQTQSTKSITEIPKPGDAVEKQEMTTKEIQEEDTLQTSCSKNTSEAASKPDIGRERKMQTTTEEIKGRDSMSGRSTTEDPKQDNRGRKREKTQEKATALDRQKTFGKSLTFNKSRPPVPAPKRLELLEKLDLKCFPSTKATAPDWLLPSTLKSLKKFYIRGGKFSDLGQYQDLGWENGGQKKHTWKVEILRLKYLSELEVDWKELQELFPDLVYLEKVSCPKLSFFPCDGYGVWIDRTKLEQRPDLYKP